LKNTGIHAISFYVPSLYLSINEIAEARKISPEKLTKGLGLQKMAIADVGEDTATMAANALLSLIEKNNINPNEIGRIYLGTESALDAAKPTSTYAVGMVEEYLMPKFGPRSFKNCDVVDLTFACIGGVDALLNCVDWVSAGTNRKAVVLTSDIAKYDLLSAGEYTQGAGAMALLITENPDLITIHEEVGVATKSEPDFFKPLREVSKKSVLDAVIKALNLEVDSADLLEKLNSGENSFWNRPSNKINIHRETPVFDGEYSNKCYQDRVREALEHYYEQTNELALDFDKVICHLPYAYQGRRMLAEIWFEWIFKIKNQTWITEIFGEIPTDNGSLKIFLKSLSKHPLYVEFVNHKIAQSEQASSEIGNMYTSSIFMALLSMFTVAKDANENLTNSQIAFLGYGSGSKSKVFKGTINKNYLEGLKSAGNIFDALNTRKKISFGTYVSHHKGEIQSPMADAYGFRLTKVMGEESLTQLGYRYYRFEG
jgi:hydroxymethylglutaryl-CoA synthase